MSTMAPTCIPKERIFKALLAKQDHIPTHSSGSSIDMSDSSTPVLKPTEPIPRLRPFSDIFADDSRNLQAMEEFATRVKIGGPLQPMSRVPLNGYAVKPEEEEALGKRFSTQYPRLLEPRQTPTQITWTRVLLESLRPSDFMSSDNEMYRCQVQGNWIQMTVQDMNEILNEVGICRRVITEPYSDAGERQTRDKLIGCLTVQMSSLVERQRVCERILTMVNGPARTDPVETESLLTPVSSTTDAPQRPSNAPQPPSNTAQEPINVESTSPSLKRPTASVVVPLPGKRPRISGYDMVTRTDAHPIPSQVHVPDSENGDIESDEESVGGDIPYDTGRRKNESSSTSSSAHQISPDQRGNHTQSGSRNNEVPRQGPAKRGLPYSDRELQEGKKFVKWLIERGHTAPEVQEKYNREFDRCRTIRRLLERYELEYMRVRLMGNAENAKRKQFASIMRTT